MDLFVYCGWLVEKATLKEKLYPVNGESVWLEKCEQSEPACLPVLNVHFEQRNQVGDMEMEMGKVVGLKKKSVEGRKCANFD